MGVGVDREQAADLEGQLDELVGRVLPLGAGVDLHGGVALEARLEDRAGVEVRLRRFPARTLDSRPVQCPRTLTRGLRTAATMRLVIGPQFIRSLVCTDAVTRSSWPSIASVWSRVPSSRMSTSMPLNSRNASPSDAVDRIDDRDLLVRRSAVRPLATRSWGEWSVSTIHSCPSSMPVSTISSIGEPPSLQSEWGGSRRATRHTGPRRRRRAALRSCPATTPGMPELASRCLLHDRGRWTCRCPAGPGGCRPRRARELVVVDLLEGLDRLAEGLDPVGARARCARGGRRCGAAPRWVRREPRAEGAAQPCPQSPRH